ncbi:hypothetical protein ON010_g10587 [Phytophthora cinnamomi]|nr:hypothetical protein ON010_g10587 [Phytophthora cinnamomi]
MMGCGLSFSVDGTWTATNLQEIIQKYPLEFAGNMKEGGETADEQEPINEDESEATSRCRIERAGTHILDEAIV